MARGIPVVEDEFIFTTYCYLVKYLEVRIVTRLTDDGDLPISRHSPNHRQNRKEQTTE
ncbi:MAG: hypothetical protein ACHQX3_05035 [Nitrospirales bacterium]